MISTSSRQQEGTLFSLKPTTRRIRQQQQPPKTKFPFVISYSIFVRFFQRAGIWRHSSRQPIIGKATIVLLSLSVFNQLLPCSDTVWHLINSRQKRAEMFQWQMMTVPVTGALTSSFPAGAQRAQHFYVPVRRGVLFFIFT